MKKKDVLSSKRLEELKRKKRRRLRNKILIFILIFVAFFVGLSFLSKWQKININQVTISGNKVIDAGKIREVIDSNANGKYLWLFPKTNFLLYPEKKIRAELLLNYKRIKEVSFSNENANSLEILISEYDGKYLWCGTSIPVSKSDTENNKCYFMDPDGYIFAEAPYFSGEVYFKFYGKNDGNLPGSHFLKDYWDNIIFLKNNLEQLKLEPTAFWLDENNDGNMALSAELVTGPRIIFKMNSDFNKLVENLQTALTTEPLQSEFKDKYSSLLYIDLRFGNKIYYKFSTENTVSEELST
jgi:predicted nucleic acid-binding Zn ribbon protein